VTCEVEKGGAENGEERGGGRGLGFVVQGGCGASQYCIRAASVLAATARALHLRDHQQP
jgi:hypothetical protein